MQIITSLNERDWESFLTSQAFSPFLQSHSIGEVYKALGEEPIRLEVRDDGQIVGICQAIVVDARRGKHLAVMYGPVLKSINGTMEQCPRDSNVDGGRVEKSSKRKKLCIHPHELFLGER